MMRWLLTAVVLGAGCAHPFRNDATVCPEYRAVRCATAPECSMDSARGCRVCQCSPAGGPLSVPIDPTPPDLRRPE